MKPKVLFGLAVRLLGLVFIYHAVSTLPGILMAVVGIATGGGNAGMIIGPVLMVLWQLLVAYWLLRGAPPLVRIAYPGSEPEA